MGELVTDRIIGEPSHFETNGQLCCATVERHKRAAKVCCCAADGDFSALQFGKTAQCIMQHLKHPWAQLLFHRRRENKRKFPLWAHVSFIPLSTDEKDRMTGIEPRRSEERRVGKERS